jgi:FkbM family methyltransferase
LREGTYIDVGIGDIAKGSVTRAFYERGWRGINVEPLESHFEAIARERPLDINLSLIVLGRAGYGQLFVAHNKATSSAELASQWRAQGINVQQVKRPCTTLTEICVQHVTGPIHILRLHAEGCEIEILQAMNFTRFRPWIVLIQGTQPDLACEEPALCAAKYCFAYADGVNRIYIAAERNSELAPYFGTPPNIHDRFVRASEWRAQREVEKLRAERLEFEQSLFESERHAGALATQRQKLAEELSTLKDENKKLRERGVSFSWRLKAFAKRVLRFLRRA